MNLNLCLQSVLRDDERYRTLGFTDDDANAYWNNLYFDSTEQEAEKKLFAGHSVNSEERQFVLEFLSHGKTSPELADFN